MKREIPFFIPWVTPTPTFYKKHSGYNTEDFPIAELVSDREVSLPLYPKMLETDVWDVVHAVEEVLNMS